MTPRNERGAGDPGAPMVFRGAATPALGAGLARGEPAAAGLLAVSWGGRAGRGRGVGGGRPKVRPPSLPRPPRPPRPRAEGGGDPPAGRGRPLGPGGVGGPAGGQVPPPPPAGPRRAV